MQTLLERWLAGRRLDRRCEGCEGSEDDRTLRRSREKKKKKGQAASRQGSAERPRWMGVVSAQCGIIDGAGSGWSTADIVGDLRCEGPRAAPRTLRGEPEGLRVRAWGARIFRKTALEIPCRFLASKVRAWTPVDPDKGWQARKEFFIHALPIKPQQLGQAMYLLTPANRPRTSLCALQTQPWNVEICLSSIIILPSNKSVRPAAAVTATSWYKDSYLSAR